jgi:hypothetical protein
MKPADKPHDGTCHACGGVVDADGFAMGGEVGEEEGVGALSLVDLGPFDDDGAESITDKRMHDSGFGFADAVRRRRR